MRNSTLERWAPLSGVLFFVLIVATLILTFDTPGTGDKTADVVKYWSDNDTQQIIGNLIGGLAVVALVWFGAVLKSAFSGLGGESKRLALLSFAGALVIAVSGAIASSIGFAAADTAGDVPGTVTQTLSVLNDDIFITFIAGVLIFNAANARVILGYGGLPRWLGWFSVVLVVITVTPIGFVGLMGSLIWVLIAAIVIFRGQEPAAPEPAAASPQAAT
jgi:hypothetical protein